MKHAFHRRDAEAPSRTETGSAQPEVVASLKRVEARRFEPEEKLFSAPRRLGGESIGLHPEETHS